MTKLVKNVFLPIGIIAVAALVVVLMMSSRGDLPRREQAALVPTVDALRVEPGSVPVTIVSRGTVTPRRNIELVSEVSGKVIWVAPEFLQGERVAEGATLLRIDPIDYEVALADAEAAVAAAELSLAEAKVLVKRAAMDEAEARLEAARQRLRQARVDLDNTQVKAPFNAIVDSKRVDLGQYVTQGAALMQLLSTGVAEIRLPILPSDIPFVRYGQHADGSWHQAQLTARFGNVVFNWQARVARMEQRVDEQTRVFYLVAEVDEPYDVTIHGQPLSVGLFVEAHFPGAVIENSVRLPRSALHEGSQVYLIVEGKLQRRSVEVVRRAADSVIVEGLAASEQVLLSKLDLLVDGMAVLVAE